MSTSNKTSGSLFDCSVEDGLACIHLHKGVFMLGFNFEEKDRLFSVFADLDKSDDVKAVLTFDSADALAADEHRRYFEQITNEVASGHYERAVNVIERENNALSEYAMLAARFSKVLVSCHTGEIASPFFGVSLMSDFRLAAPSMSYRLSHVDLGLPPVAGLSFLLPKFVGSGRATHWLLSGGTIDAETAYQLGLVTAVLDQGAFVGACLDWVDNALASGIDHVEATRRLIYREYQELSPEFAEQEKRRTRALLYKKSKGG